MTELKQLLRKWAALEPDRCRVNGPHQNDYFVAVGENWSRPFWNVDGEGLGGGWDVFAAVVEAIEARGWDYRLAWRMAPTGEHFGVVKIDREDGWSKSWSCYAGSPAAALLGAYLAALEGATSE